MANQDLVRLIDGTLFLPKDKRCSLEILGFLSGLRFLYCQRFSEKMFFYPSLLKQ